MSAAPAKPRFAVGEVLRATPRCMNRERMRWYVDALFTAKENDGKQHIGERNIHTDDEYARSQGLPGIISDGMISTNWIYNLLLDTFGADFLRAGSLRTKYVMPITENRLVSAGFRVLETKPSGDRTRYGLEVWCEDDSGTILTVGAASVVARH
ncbi:MAG: MaoC family dehydratase [Xanthobacteraceae bacterium]